MREPVRTCVGCRMTASKWELVRIVRDRTGTPVPDPSGKAAGRGAYVHPSAACIDEALRRGALARALRAGLDREGAVRLQADLERLLAVVRAPTGSTGSTGSGSTGRQAGST